MPKTVCLVEAYVGQGGFALPLFFDTPREKRTMFEFEVLVGTKSHEALMSKLLDLAAKGKEVHYLESPGTLVVRLNGRPPRSLEGMIARGRAFT